MAKEEGELQLINEIYSLRTIVYLTLDDTIDLMTYLNNILNVIEKVKNHADSGSVNKTSAEFMDYYTLIFVADKIYFENHIEEMWDTILKYNGYDDCYLGFLSPKATENYEIPGGNGKIVKVQNKIPLSKDGQQYQNSMWYTGRKFPIQFTKPGFNILFRKYNGLHNDIAVDIFKMKEYHVKIEDNNNIIVNEITVMNKAKNALSTAKNAAKNALSTAKNRVLGNTETEGGKTRKHRKRKMRSSKRKANKKGRKSRKKNSSSRKKK